MLFETKKAIRNHPAYKKEKERIVKLLRLIKAAQKETDLIEWFIMGTYDPWEYRENEFYNLRHDSCIYLQIELEKEYFSYSVKNFHELYKTTNTEMIWFYANMFGKKLLGNSNYDEKVKLLKELTYRDPWDLCRDIKFSGPFEPCDEWWVSIRIHINDDYFIDCLSSNRERNYKHREVLVDELNELKTTLTPLKFPKKPEVKVQPKQPTEKSKVTVNQTAPKQNTAQNSQPIPGQNVSGNQARTTQNTIPRPQPLYRAPLSEHKIISCPHCDGLVRYPRNIHQRSYIASICPHCDKHINLKNIN